MLAWGNDVKLIAWRSNSLPSKELSLSGHCASVNVDSSSKFQLHFSCSITKKIVSPRKLRLVLRRVTGDEASTDRVCTVQRLAAMKQQLLRLFCAFH